MTQSSGSQEASALVSDTGKDEAGSGGGGAVPESRSGSEPQRHAEDTSQGRTSISPSVVQKIAGIAAKEISGVYSMGGGASRAFGAIKERIPGGGTSNTSGVQTEVGEKQAAVDLDMVVEYGVSIMDLARAVRRNVINGVERMTGLQVIEVNISVNAVYLPSEDGDGENETSSRVQ